MYGSGKLKHEKRRHCESNAVFVCSGLFQRDIVIVVGSSGTAFEQAGPLISAVRVHLEDISVCFQADQDFIPGFIRRDGIEDSIVAYGDFQGVLLVNVQERMRVGIFPEIILLSPFSFSPRRYVLSDHTKYIPTTNMFQSKSF